MWGVESFMRKSVIILFGKNKWARPPRRPPFSLLPAEIFNGKHWYINDLLSIIAYYFLLFLMQFYIEKGFSRYRRFHGKEMQNCHATIIFAFCMLFMAILVVEFSNGGYKIRKIFA